GSKDAARRVEQDLSRHGVRDIDIRRSRGLYKVLVGPFDRADTLARMSERVVELGYERPHQVTR
ncbi:MAG: SPOR domain-containing protein, partial [Xanthomonadales bacterium]|nr:SPOR domain-containing protein [Xanthomonadales bacterium]